MIKLDIHAVGAFRRQGCVLPRKRTCQRQRSGFFGEFARFCLFFQYREPALFPRPTCIITSPPLNLTRSGQLPARTFTRSDQDSPVLCSRDPLHPPRSRRAMRCVRKCCLDCYWGRVSSWARSSRAESTWLLVLCSRRTRKADRQNDAASGFILKTRA